MAATAYLAARREEATFALTLTLHRHHAAAPPPLIRSKEEGEAVGMLDLLLAAAAAPLLAASPHLSIYLGEVQEEGVGIWSGREVASSLPR